MSSYFPEGPPQGDPGPLLAMLGGGEPQGPPPEEQQQGGPEDEPISLLKQMLQLAAQYLQVEPDEEDKATMAKVQATLQQYLAKDQADAQQALGGNPAISRIMRKSGF